VIAVFTKYDQFRRDVQMKLEYENRDPADLDAEMERIFNRYYLSNLRDSPPFVRLERECFVNQPVSIALISVPQECTSLANDVLIFLK
jgi:hypothetical protein